MIVTQQWIGALHRFLRKYAHGFLVLVFAAGVLFLRVRLLLVYQGVREPAIMIQFQNEVFVGLVGRVGFVCIHLCGWRRTARRIALLGFLEFYFLHDLLPHRVRVFAHARVGVVREVGLLGNAVVLHQ